MAAAIVRTVGASRHARAQALVVHAVGIALVASSAFMVVFLNLQCVRIGVTSSIFNLGHLARSLIEI
jgi:hypothetical protein